VFSSVWKLFWEEYRLRPALSCVLLILSGLMGGMTLAALLPLMTTAFSVGQGRDVILFKLFEQFFHWMGASLTLKSLVTFVFIVVTVKAATIIAQMMVLQSMLLGVEQRRKRELFDRLLRTRLSFFYSTDFGWLTSIIMQQTKMMGVLVREFSRFGASITNVVFYCVVSLLASWKVSLFTVLASLLFYAIIRPTFSLAKRWAHRSAEGYACMQRAVNDTLRGYETIKSYANERLLAGVFGSALRDYARAQMKMVSLEAVLKCIFEPAAVVLGVIAFTAFDLDMGTLVVFGVALSRAYQNLQLVQNAHYKLMQHIPSLELYDKMYHRLNAQQYPDESKGCPFDSLGTEIRFADVTYSYDVGDQHFSFGPANLVLPKGKTIGLAGPSGSGKSTIVSLLVGLLRPTGGTVLVDGRDLSSFAMTSYRRKLAYVAQETFLLNDTVRNNVSFGRDDISMEQIRKACQLAYADEFIRALPSGYDTVLGEHGARLSGGQRQRIALARALAAKPDILILDEATSALDNESERQIQRSIENLRGAMTIVIVAHRLTTIRKVDHVYVIENGQITEEGNPEGLAQRGSRFHEMHAASH